MFVCVRDTEGRVWGLGWDGVCVCFLLTFGTDAHFILCVIFEESFYTTAWELLTIVSFD